MSQKLPIKERASMYSKYIRASPDYNRFDASALRNVELLHAEARDPKTGDKDKPLAYTVWKVYVPEELTNAGNALHGGAVATLFDMLTSFTISACDKIEGTGWEVNNVSRTLNCAYLKPILQGEYMRVECEVTALGKRNGLCRGVMKKWNKNAEDGAGGDVCYTCEHGKVNTGIESPKL
ncbi:hypothetical protein SLS56_010156 [Neofusicoccum ribis]|uniref:Thioesterase domain-containing protein n=1 Tax=Neofusicoccum ribis TaxID=45134 RepID=A0ABR3SF74_9PEZI